MKKVLLGTTALFAAAMLPHAAFADDQPVKLSISGDLQFGYGAAINEKEGAVSSNNLPDSAKFYGVIDLSGDTKFKNGIGAGAFIEFFGQPQNSGATEPNQTESAVKQEWIHLTGDSFGEVRFGDYTDARRAKAIFAPTWSQNAMFGANSPDIAFIGNGINTNTTAAFFGNRFMTEVSYFSPTFDGAQLSLSYAPDNGNFSSGGPGTPTITPASGTYTYGASTTQIRDVFSGALTWGGTVAGLSIAADVGMTSGQSKKASSSYIPSGDVAAPYPTIAGNPLAYDAGFTVGAGPWVVGASFEQTENLRGSFGNAGNGLQLNSEQIDKTLDVGGTYTIGNLTAGVEWTRGIYEGGASVAAAGGDAKGRLLLDTITPGASYIIGPGVDIDAGVAYNVTHGGGADATGLAAAKGHDTILEFGTEVKF